MQPQNKILVPLIKAGTDVGVEVAGIGIHGGWGS